MHTMIHKATDMSYNLDGNTFDVYALVLESCEVAVLDIRYKPNGSKTVRFVKDDPDRQFDGFFCDEQVMGAMLCLMVRDFGEDHSFFHEAFYDEDGAPIEKLLRVC